MNLEVVLQVFIDLERGDQRIEDYLVPIHRYSEIGGGIFSGRSDKPGDINALTKVTQRRTPLDHKAEINVAQLVGICYIVVERGHTLIYSLDRDGILS